MVLVSPLSQRIRYFCPLLFLRLFQCSPFRYRASFALAPESSVSERGKEQDGLDLIRGALPAAVFGMLVTRRTSTHRTLAPCSVSTCSNVSASISAISFDLLFLPVLRLSASLVRRRGSRHVQRLLQGDRDQTGRDHTRYRPSQWQD